MLFLSFMQSFDLLTPLKTTLIISQKEGKKMWVCSFPTHFSFCKCPSSLQLLPCKELHITIVHRHVSTENWGVKDSN